MKQGRGVSLAETVMALFLLTGVVLVLVTLLQTLLRYGRRIEMRSLATLAADRHIEQIRSWARQKTGTTYNFENLVSTYAGTQSTDPEYPGLTLTTQAVLHPLDVPSTALEQPYTDRRRLNTSAVLVRVTAAWNGSGQGQPVGVTSLIGAPARLAAPTLTVSHVNGALPIPALGNAVFRAQARDVDNQPLNDVTFHWYIVPQTGNASVALNRRDSTEARVTNRVRYPDGSFGPASGTCLVEVRALYRGRELTGVSSPVSLAP